MLPILLTLLAGAFLTAGIVVFAARRPGYSHVRHTISDLGEVGAPNARRASFGLFLPFGLALLAVAVLVRQAEPAVALLALCITTGYIVAAFFPSDPGSPAWGSWRQTVHNLGGAVEYAGGALAFFELARDYGSILQASGFVVGIGMILIAIPDHPVRGLVQRIVEATLLGGLLLALWKVQLIS